MASATRKVTDSVFDDIPSCHLRASIQSTPYDGIVSATSETDRLFNTLNESINVSATVVALEC
jgi:hypothetical protein